MKEDLYELYNAKKLTDPIKLILINSFLKLQIGYKNRLKKVGFYFLTIR
ncbi:hypothetical protein BALU111458_09900 [Bacillus luti]